MMSEAQGNPEKLLSFFHKDFCGVTKWSVSEKNCLSDYYTAQKRMTSHLPAHRLQYPTAGLFRLRLYLTSTLVSQKYRFRHLRSASHVPWCWKIVIPLEHIVKITVSSNDKFWNFCIKIFLANSHDLIMINLNSCFMNGNMIGQCSFLQPAWYLR